MKFYSTSSEIFVLILRREIILIGGVCFITLRHGAPLRRGGGSIRTLEIRPM